MVDTLHDAALESELSAVYRLYAALSRRLDPHAGLGGKLLYAGLLDQEGIRLVRAANVAGAASLCATADSGIQKRAICDGIVDFLVTSLDEALRILKNEIRKRRGVAVGIALAPETVEPEMLARGVLPDLLFPGSRVDAWTDAGAEVVEMAAIPPGKKLLTVFLPSGPGLNTEIETLLLDSLPDEDWAGRRWLRLSPRYLDPRARRIRSLVCSLEAVSPLLKRIDRKLAGRR